MSTGFAVQWNDIRGKDWTPETLPDELDECGCCGGFHRPDYRGECRNDWERFPTWQIDAVVRKALADHPDLPPSVVIDQFTDR